MTTYHYKEDRHVMIEQRARLANPPEPAQGAWSAGRAGKINIGSCVKGAGRISSVIAHGHSLFAEAGE